MAMARGMTLSGALPLVTPPWWALIWEVARGETAFAMCTGEGDFMRLAVRGAGTGGVSSSVGGVECGESGLLRSNTGLESTDLDFKLESTATFCFEVAGMGNRRAEIWAEFEVAVVPALETGEGLVPEERRFVFDGTGGAGMEPRDGESATATGESGEVFSEPARGRGIEGLLDGESVGGVLGRTGDALKWGEKFHTGREAGGEGEG